MSRQLLALLLDRTDSLPRSRFRLLFSVVAAAGVIAIVRIWEPLGAPGDLSVVEAPRWDPDVDVVQMTIASELSNPRKAIADYHVVLQASPDHLLATYHLARVLDASAKTEEAAAVWGRAERFADYEGDIAIGLEARARLAPRVSDEELMSQGLAALYERGDLLLAIGTFHRVLARSPEHHGATFQLATALDRAKKTGDSRVVWERVLALSLRYGDAPTAEIARLRMAAIDAGSP